jgi:hypothetical protein
MTYAAGSCLTCCGRTDTKAHLRRREHAADDDADALGEGALSADLLRAIRRDAADSFEHA